ncbi:MAG: 50S ribosomal protein L3 [Candidatus Pacebacteria bacterium]|nr:50S ribosomal protein L3 [Candidatus Paceibacterota bacterium]MDD5721610.1 50S ribosomal protein L3 [Candidatus Paceibacterota bacterium]
MKITLAKKLEMSQVFNEQGNVVPVTIIQAGPVVITQLKTKEKDGYQAIQVGFGKKNNKFQWFEEFNLEKNKLNETEMNNLKIGDEIKVDVFEEGDKVRVTGKSKGKGFQGVVKRHGFKGAPASHGTKDQLRAPGSIGQTGIQRVMKGKKMPGRMGFEQITLKGVKVIKVIPEKNLLYLKGAIPGRRNSLLKISG